MLLFDHADFKDGVSRSWYLVSSVLVPFQLWNWAVQNRHETVGGEVAQRLVVASVGQGLACVTCCASPWSAA
jgi:hypothetical protein